MMESADFASEADRTNWRQAAFVPMGSEMDDKEMERMSVIQEVLLIISGRTSRWKRDSRINVTPP